MFLGFLCVVACIRTWLLLWPIDVPLYVYTTFIHSSTDGHVACFHRLAVVSDAAGTLPYKYLFQSLLSLLLGPPLWVELLGHVVILCLAFCATVQLACPDRSAPVSHSHQQCTMAPISAHPHQRLSHSFPAFLTVLSQLSFQEWSLWHDVFSFRVQF